MPSDSCATTRTLSAGPVYDYSDLVADPKIAHNGTFVEYDHPTEGRIKTPGFPYKFPRPPPKERARQWPGEHSGEILRFAGYNDRQIDGLIAAGVVGETKE